MQHLRQVDHDGVTNAHNPSTFGYHHGPIPNPNDGWLPSRQRLAQQNGARAPNITARDVAEAPPNPAQSLSAVNGLVCDIVIAEGNIMCGTQFTQQPAYRRHLRDKHPGCTLPPTRQNVSNMELARGECALKLWVRSGGWRNALYARDPGTGPKDGLLYQYATMMEQIAKEDSAFAEKHGTQFHREPSATMAYKTPRSRSKRMRDTSEEAEIKSEYLSTTDDSGIGPEQSPSAAEEGETDFEFLSTTENSEIEREDSPDAAEDVPTPAPRMPCTFLLTRKRQKQ